MSSETHATPAPAMQARSKILSESAREALVDLGERQQVFEEQARELEARAHDIRRRSSARARAVFTAIRKDHGIPAACEVRFEPADAARFERATWREPAAVVVTAPAEAADQVAVLKERIEELERCPSFRPADAAAAD